MKVDSVWFGTQKIEELFRDHISFEYGTRTYTREEILEMKKGDIFKSVHRVSDTVLHTFVHTVL